MFGNQLAISTRADNILASMPGGHVAPVSAVTISSISGGFTQDDGGTNEVQHIGS